MKLSMQIVENWIQKYHPISTISSTEPTITGIRLFSYDKTPDPDYLYVGRAKDFFERSSSEEVLLVHRKDVISLSTHELEDVFDAVMDAYVFYSNWEQKMFAAFQQPNPEQLIIDACQPVFGPMFFTNMSLQVTAYSRNYPLGSINQNWDDFIHMGTLSIESMDRLQHGVFLQKMTEIWNCEEFYEETAGPYPYSLMVSQENAVSELTGQMTLISREPFPEYQKHLAAFLKRALCFVAVSTASFSGNPAINLFGEILAGKQNHQASDRLLTYLSEWEPEHYCLISILCKPDEDFTPMDYYLKYLQSRFPKALFMLSRENSPSEVICGICLPSFDPPEQYSLPAVYRQSFDKLHLNAYASLPLRGVHRLRFQYLQARYAREMQTQDFYSCALSVLTSWNASQTLREHSLHPVLEQLKRYDSKKRTDFYELLKIYLRNERNRVITAEKLYVHKNTLVYRLEKIQKKFHLQLDDPYEREYLLLSYRFAESMKQKP